MLLTRFHPSLPQPAYSATQVLSHEQEVARQLNIPLLSLMLEAGRAVFDYIMAQHHTPQKVLFVCGKGNNGGDGFVAAKLALESGFDVEVLCIIQACDLKGDAAKAYHQLIQLSDIENRLYHSTDLSLIRNKITQFSGSLIVDALLGIGFKGQLSADFQSIIKAINDNKASVLSVDVPSGLNANTGCVSTNAVVADGTLTFIVAKQGLLTGQASLYVGHLYLADLNVGNCFQASLAADVFVQGIDELPPLIERMPTMHKGHIGLALTIGGNENMPGAIKLASEAALRSGAALVAVCSHASHQTIMINQRPELMLAPNNAQALATSPLITKAKVILIGPGLGQNVWAAELFRLAIGLDKPMVIDADALRILSTENISKKDWILTPHPAEAASLLGITTEAVERDRFDAVRTIAQKYGGICVLKGAGSLISDGQRVWINQTGNAGMATGGMGDVLSGIITAFVMQSTSLFDAARLAVSIHGQAGDILAKEWGQRGMLASDLFEPLRCLVNRY